jgi:arylsulfatase A-like enzyme
MPVEKKPNILVIRGDDIGIWNLSCYSQGTMGYRTPNFSSRKPASISPRITTR